MSNLDNITTKIIEDAKLKAEKIIEDAKISANEAINQKVLTGNRKKDEIIARAEVDAKTLIERKLSKQNLDARDELLSAKEKVVKEVIGMIKDKLKNLDDKTYLKYLKKSLKQFEGKNDLILIVPEDKRKLVKKEDLPIELSNEEAISSGFAVRENNMYYNFDFDGQIDSIRDDLTVEIINKLFES